MIRCDALFAHFSLDGTIVAASSGFAQTVGSQEDLIAGMSFDTLLPACGSASFEVLRAQMETNKIAHVVLTCAETQDEAHCKFYPTHGAAGEVTGYVAIGVERSAPQETQSQLERHAYEDALTGLFNRRYLEQMVTQYLKDPEAQVALLVLDLVDFKTINDTHGHEAGDKVLQHVAQQLTQAVPLGETVIRLGGDEFVIVLEDAPSRDFIALVTRDLQKSVAQPIEVKGKQIKVEVSIGAATSTEAGRNLRDLLGSADEAMYADKRAEEPTAAPMAMPIPKSAMHRSDLTPETIRPYYQPIVRVKDGAWVGVEALCRIQHPTRGLLSPISFISWAENEGVIDELDRLMFEAICKDHAKLAACDLPALQTSFNLSRGTLRSPNLISFLQSTLETHGLNAGNFRAELTESMALMEHDLGSDFINELQEAGFSVALDDFGTGFTSLALLKTLRVSTLKVDASFIRDITTSSRDRTIVEAVALLAHSLETELMAEGVESYAQLEILNQIGIDNAQGFYFAEPKPFDAYATALTAQQQNASNENLRAFG